MAGHSKWAQIKRKKATEDARRGREFSKLARALQVAVREGGPDESKNPHLRTLLAKAKEINMPRETIERAIMKGTGELSGENYEELYYEGYGPGGAALLIEILTDNRRRTASEIRTIMSRGGGSLGESGCVSWIFEKKGVMLVPISAVDEDTLMNIAVEAGADEVTEEGEYFQITCPPEKLEELKNAFAQKNIQFESAEISMTPKTTVEVKGKEALSLLRLVDALEEHEDVQNVYSNFDIPDEVLKEAKA